MEKISKEDAQIWANGLRSGKYKQAKGALQNPDGYCCLGVACELFIPKELQVRGRLQGFLSGGVVDEFSQPNAPKWLQNINNDLRSKLDNDCFIDANDNQGYSFNEIADIIELVYVHEAL